MEFFIVATLLLIEMNNTATLSIKSLNGPVNYMATVLQKKILVQSRNFHPHEPIAKIRLTTRGQGCECGHVKVKKKGLAMYFTWPFPVTLLRV